MSEEKSKDLLDVMVQIDRICRGLLADVDRQAEIAEELTRFLPEEQRQMILLRMQATRDRLAAFEA